MITCYSVASVFFIPGFFAIKFQKMSTMPDEVQSNKIMGYWTLTEFGLSTFFKVYSLILLLFETIIPLGVLITMSVISLRKFRKIMVRKRSIKNDKKNFIIAAEMNFTRLIIALTSICILTRTFDSIMAIYYREKLFFDIKFSETLDAMLYFIKHISTGLLFGAHSLDGLLYYSYDIQMKRLFDKKSDAEQHEVHELV